MVSVLSLFALLAAPFSVYTWRHMRIIKLESLHERIIWTFRSWLWNYPVPLDPDQWQISDPLDMELYGREARAIQRTWKFLEPFFASRGYTLYQSYPPRLFDLLPAPATKPSKPRATPEFPYARRAYERDEEMMFPFIVRIFTLQYQIISGH